jgi:hypothetical protein
VCVRCSGALLPPSPQLRRPPHAKIRPGRPAPATGPGTLLGMTHGQHTPCGGKRADPGCSAISSQDYQRSENRHCDKYHSAGWHLCQKIDHLPAPLQSRRRQKKNTANCEHVPMGPRRQRCDLRMNEDTRVTRRPKNDGDPKSKSVTAVIATEAGSEAPCSGGRDKRMTPFLPKGAGPIL